MKRKPLAFAVVIGLGLCGVIVAQNTGPKAKPPPAGGDAGFPNLVAGLKETPGCLGVETARVRGGKNVIFAWFENKAAVVKWYRSDMHMGVMKRFFPEDTPRAPLKGISDDEGPIMVIASITMLAKPTENGPPISQIAIELYKPLPGGAFLGERFAPAKVKVPGMADYTEEKK